MSNFELLRMATSLPFANNLFGYIHAPVRVGKYNPGKVEMSRVNHYLIKTPGSIKTYYDEKVNSELQAFCNMCLQNALESGLEVEGRYAYLTFDNDPVEATETQRSAGWHIDGMQGDEVVEKTNGCYQYLWCDELPTEFALQEFDASKLNPSVHNYFTQLGYQVDDRLITVIDPFQVYLMSSYSVHRATLATKTTQRQFARLYISHQPITSVKMTVNKAIKYPFKIHTTAGQIPDNLV